MKKLLCKVGIHSYTETRKLEVNTGGMWHIVKSYKICDRCFKSVQLI